MESVSTQRLRESVVLPGVNALGLLTPLAVAGTIVLTKADPIGVRRIPLSDTIVSGNLGVSIISNAKCTVSMLKNVAVPGVVCEHVINMWHNLNRYYVYT